MSSLLFGGDGCGAPICRLLHANPPSNSAQVEDRVGNSSSASDNGKQGFVTSYAKILGLYQQVVNGVQYLHQLGMSHGDLKPQNVLVSGDQVKITDFGASILPEDMYARTRENGGTILYSAPEIVGTTKRGRSREVLFAADIYSLGVLLYHLITSRLPHDMTR
jgi:eukaryotic-like serine/threonine-protein kinase